jgi:hypothetical protein
MKSRLWGAFCAGAFCLGLAAPATGADVLYNQDFESPVGFTNNGSDLDGSSVNDLYGGQPAGFNFAQQNTVETLLLTGSAAFGTGYSDPAGTGGNYALGMLSSAQNDLLGLAFDVGAFDYLNFSLDISSIDLSCCGGPFVSQGAIPNFQFTLFDNPGGALTTGGGTILDQATATGVASAQSVLDWTHVLVALDASASTNGNVILQVDLLDGGYAAFDNFLIVSSDTPGDIGEIPVPAAIWLFGSGFLALAGMARRVRTV